MDINYVERSLILVFLIIGCISVSAFASLVWTSIGIEKYERVLIICTITARIKTHKSVIRAKNSMIKQY